jgi:hypothetical protein
MASFAGDPEIDPPVFCAAFFGAVICDMMLLAITLCLQAVSLNAQLNKFRHDRFSAQLGQLEICLGIPGAVSVSANLECHPWVFLQDFSNVLELFLGFRLQDNLAGIEMEPVKGKPRLVVYSVFCILDESDLFVLHTQLRNTNFYAGAAF